MPVVWGVLDLVEAEPSHRAEGPSLWATALVVRWHKRRLRCVEVGCPRKTFTETIEQIPLGARLTGRLRRAMAEAIGDANRSTGSAPNYAGSSTLMGHAALVALPG